MQLEKAKIETWTKHNYNTNTDYDQKDEYFIKLTFEVPGGVAIYDIRSLKDINESLEAANNLKIIQGKKK